MDHQLLRAAVSPDNGETWGVYPGTIRQPEAGNEKFQMGAFLKPGPGDPYLYTYGTPSGRSGSAYVARVAPALVPDLTKYEYWSSDANAWVPANPAAATPVIPGPMGEMSAQYNTYLKQYLVLYTNRANDVVMRTAPAPQGPWGPEQMLVSSMFTPGGVYAPYPASVVDGQGAELQPLAVVGVQRDADAHGVAVVCRYPWSTASYPRPLAALGEPMVVAGKCASVCHTMTATRRRVRSAAIAFSS